MKKKLISTVLTLLFTVSTTFGIDFSTGPHRAAAHMIIMEKLESELPQVPTGFVRPRSLKQGALCTATAIGPHALLTANHCDMGNTELFVDERPSDSNAKALHVLGRMLDHEDHIIFLVDGPAFKGNIAAFYKIDKTATRVGENVFMYGDGRGMFPPELRKGYRMGTLTIPADQIDKEMPQDAKIILYDLNIVPGDSGSAVFSQEDGRLVAIVTYSIVEHFMGAYRLAFTQWQLTSAETFPGK